MRPPKWRPSPRAAALALALLVGAAGCQSNGDSAERVDVDPDGITVQIKPPPSGKIELPRFQVRWDDIGTDNQGRRDSFEVARWRTERHNAVMQCLHAQPPARVQALALLEEIVQRVPDSTRDRYLLAETRFGEAAYWYQAADVVAYNNAWVLDTHQLPPAAGSTRLNDQEVEELVAQYKVAQTYANENLVRTANEALRHYSVYRQMRPDDRSVFERLWRLYFYLQHYDHALTWLDLVFRELDANEVPRDEPRRREYQMIRDQIVNYLTERQVDGGRPEPIRPWANPAASRDVFQQGRN